MVAVLVSGCGGPAGGGGKDLQTRRQLSLVARAYSDYLALHGNAPPASEGAFVATFADYQPQLQALGLDEPSGLLVSPRDGQPFLVAYDAKTSRQRAPWIAVEREGVEGKLLGVQARGVLEEVTPDQLPEAIRSALAK
ncbi:MAG: hypothetical protein ACRCT8_12655 [Lacipirellulaceae bacterium]